MCQKRIEIKNVSVTFPNGARVLDEVSLVLPERTRTVVIGESGSGKSVMLAALLGILPAGAGVSGSFYLDGEDLFLLPEKKMEKIRGRKLGYIPQGSGNSLNPLLKVGLQIAEPLMETCGIGKKEAVKEAILWMKKLHLGQEELLAEAYPHTLSGGMKQRVLIAMGSASGAKILLADEPTKGLDEERVELVIELIRQLKGRTLLCVSHDLHFAEAVADRVCVMYASQQVEECSREAFFGEPLHPYSRMMLEALPERGMRGDFSFAPPHEKYGEMGCHFYSRCPQRSGLCRKKPPLVERGGRKVRCWQYADPGR